MTRVYSHVESLERRVLLSGAAPHADAAPAALSIQPTSVVALALPESIAGVTVTLTITNGVFPFPSTGTYQFITSQTGDTYQIIGGPGVPDSTGTYNYTRTGASSAIVTLDDNTLGFSYSIVLSFTSPTSGNYSIISPFGSQSGTFAIPPAEFTVGVFRNGNFILDLDASMNFTGGVDIRFNFGLPGDRPVVGDWNGDSVTEVGVFRDGNFFLDSNGNLAFNPGVDADFFFGMAGDLPVAGDFNGDGTDDIGVFRNGRFILDSNGNRAFNPGVDANFAFGLPGDKPVIGDWNGDGIDDVGVFRNGRFILDSNGNRAFDAISDTRFFFGTSSDIPISGDWNGDGSDDIGVFRSGRFILDSDASRSFSAGVDQSFFFGLPGDEPVTGRWSPF